MPLYEYSDAETGVRIEISRKVEDRNNPIVLVRSKTVPDRVSILGFGLTPNQQYNKDILAGWYAQEQKQGSKLNTAEFTKEQIKKIWTTDD